MSIFIFNLGMWWGIILNRMVLMLTQMEDCSLIPTSHKRPCGMPRATLTYRESRSYKLVAMETSPRLKIWGQSSLCRSVSDSAWGHPVYKHRFLGGSRTVTILLSSNLINLIRIIIACMLYSQLIEILHNQHNCCMLSQLAYHDCNSLAHNIRMRYLNSVL